MSKESYIRGFVKAAEEKGIDPAGLAEYKKTLDKAYEAADFMQSAPTNGVLGGVGNAIRGAGEIVRRDADARAANAATAMKAREEAKRELSELFMKATKKVMDSNWSKWWGSRPSAAPKAAPATYP